ncbi:DUF481 domain-containing protein [Persephonella atlantica]|uniref:DUF481 domain-containing protein n=1 Tax=Persephonella atlantica TaxID=2699429 RepID=A0ABS1GIU4_9AQUI|nr:DUF481 domain-containing protein [Persephonella atlantica]MBK3332801.1 DUF481 domain-containing protein [Persephonella atlantica]
MKKRFILATAVLTGISAISYAQEEKPLKLHGELSYVKTSGNSKTETFATKLEVLKVYIKNRLTGKGEFLYGKTNNTENTNKLYLLGRWERLFNEKLFGFLQGDYLKDKFSGYDYRTVWSAGIGYDIIKTEKHYLKGLISIGYTFEDFKTGGSNDYTTGTAELDYTWQILENLKFKEEFRYRTNLEDTNVYFVNSDSSVQVKINAHFSLGVGYKIAYQNRPPSPGIKKTDTTFLTSLIVDF